MMWRPTTTLAVIQQRAELYRQIREFFAKKNVLEVETPLLSQSTIPDPHIHSLTTHLFNKTYYLQTSPEFHMKRLLAFGTGSIFQICKAFRNDEQGQYHNPEFSMLEWYRLGFDHHQLMDEIEEFLHYILQSKSAKRYTYQQIFQEVLNIDPFSATIHELNECARKNKLDVVNREKMHRDDWLNLLMSYYIEPKLNHPQTPFFIYDFPASQAALARKNPHNPQLAARFEVYLHGIELANGFHELQDAKEQRQRFAANNIQRKELSLPTIGMDENFLQALEAGLPDCAGVALGLDRLLMLKLHVSTLEEVIGFTITNV